jgi:catechol 2,3-dioxygenase-like lactoylglutathione lyase family enzyme
MSVQLNHTIVPASDPQASATWWAEMLGLEAPERFGHFWQITADNGVSFDFDLPHAGIVATHYAFLVGEEDWDATFGRIQERGVDYFADPMGHEAGEINHHDGGRGVYFPDPDGHWLEIITVPYGGRHPVAPR